MSDYVTDPGLLAQLNDTEYVSDPSLLEKLNAPEQNVNPGDYASIQAGMSARPYAQLAYEATGGVRDLANIAKNLTGVQAHGYKEMLANPVQTAKAFIGGYPTLQKGLDFVRQGGTGMAKSMAGAALSPLTVPENLFTVPYTMAAYEQEKIRQNPNMPGLEYNPFAQVQRGEAQTQGQAAASNQMRAIANMPYGNVSPEERRILEEDRMMKDAIRKKAFQKVMGPVVPGSF